MQTFIFQHSSDSFCIKTHRNIVAISTRYNNKVDSVKSTLCCFPYKVVQLEVNYRGSAFLTTDFTRQPASTFSVILCGSKVVYFKSFHALLLNLVSRLPFFLSGTSFTFSNPVPLFYLNRSSVLSIACT